MSCFRFVSTLFVALSITMVAGCTKEEVQKMQADADNTVIHDRDINYTKNDYRDAMQPRALDPNEMSQAGANIPDMAPVMAEDKKTILPQPLVSITVNQDVSIRDIFYELAKQAEVDLELDPTITGSVIFTAYNRPFDQVVERIADMAGLRYTYKAGVLRVERDTPYLKTYTLDYLSMKRDFTSKISSNTSASAGATAVGGQAGGGDNGSTSSITSSSQSDFWVELGTNLTQIIGTTNQQVNLTDQSAPLTTPTAIPAVSADQLATVNGTTPAAAATPPTPAAPPVAGLANPTGTQSAATAADQSGAGGVTANPYFSFNKQAGLLNVFASDKQQREVANYLTKLRRTTMAQVLVEAKVFEVELKDEFATGIDWSLISGGEGRTGISLPRPEFTINPVDPLDGATFVYNSGDFDLAIDLISRFGTVRTLSSPRLTVMNNQTALLNVSENRVFFELTINNTVATASTPGRIDVTSEIKTVPEGVIIAVHPTVDMDTNQILMNLRPSITRIVGRINDPAASAITGAPDNLIPELSVRELDSVVRMNSGETIVMGGLMQDRAGSERQAVPVLSDVPIVGNLFRSKNDSIKKTEMVIFIRAKVIDSAKPDKTDKDLYGKFGGTDRRPFAM